MRLFIAINPTHEAQEQLAQYFKDLNNARWTPFYQLHLTIRFIGPFPAEKIDLLKSKLANINLPSFALKIDKLGFFSYKKDPTILWAGIKNNQSLINLRQKIDQELNLFNISLEKKEFHPHFTLARLKKTSLKTIQIYLNKYNPLNMKEFSIKEFILYSSSLTPQGAQHNIERPFPLY